MRNFTVSRNSLILIAVVIVTACLVSWWHGNAVVQGRWHAFGAAFHILGAYAVAISVTFGLAVASAVSADRRLLIITTICFAAIVASSFVVSNSRANGALRDEIALHIEAGMVSDCASVLERYATDPRLDDGGYIRFFPDSKEYASLPTSIREFTPVYVTIERWNGIPLNVGLCKNGFGGFHMGLRVFSNDPHIEPSPGRERVAPNTYLWVDET